MINKKLEEISLDDIQLLIDNSVCESKTLEYKSKLTIGTDNDKKEFLADISSFANSVGGDIIIGLEEDEKEKIPTNICGILYQNEDSLIRQVESLIRDSIQPIILNIQIRLLPLENSKCILIIRIPQSLISPHRVEYKNSGKFYNRNNKGKYPMDVNELRLAFNSGIDLSKRIEEYKTDRYYNLIANKYKKLIDDLPIFTIHYIPLSSLNNSLNHLALSNIKSTMQKVDSKAFGYGYSKNITIDSISINYNDNNYSAIAEYKNNGIIEKATTVFFKKQYSPSNINPSPTIDFISGYQIINKLLEDFNEVKEYYKNIEINSPIIISCAFLNAFGYTIPTRDWYDIYGQIDRDILYINDLYIEDFNNASEQLLKPIFDSIWNACGYEKCPAFDDEGKYIGLR